MLVTVIIAVYCLAISPVEWDTVNADGKVDLILKFNFPFVMFVSCIIVLYFPSIMLNINLDSGLIEK